MSPPLPSADLGIVLPVRVTDEARARNLYLVLAALQARTTSRLVLVESGPPRAAALLRGLRPVPVLADSAPPDAPWNKARLLNAGLAALDTPFAATWDADVLVPPAQLQAALHGLRAGEADLLVPFDGPVFDLPAEELVRRCPRLDLDALRGAPLPRLDTGTGAPPPGGIHLFARAAVQAAGGYNEHFVGWGREDDEFWHRIARLGLRRGRVAGPLYHLRHPRASAGHYAANDALYQRLGALDAAALRAEVATWPWTRPAPGG